MLAPIQIMWICILISQFAERALISEIPDSLAHTKPRKANAALISKNMWKNIILWTFMIVLIYLLIVGFTNDYFEMAYVKEDFGHYVSESWIA
jgi:magnesium-transporting ATPase (P-type)